MPKLDSNLYGSDDQGAANAIDTKLDVPTPTLDVHGETDSRAKSEDNSSKKG